ncbi:hypothetical protein DLH72_02840 [Candidatus Gracilibacteria bacterium]|nr:MAG: hypothetical protein DLH72_02840 [Candidatus Gracilibacteria bacterium]
MQENIKENSISKTKKELESGIFGFWTAKLRVSFLVLLLLVIAGFFSLIMIQKESSPRIDIGYIGITTIYNGVSPSDIDSLITEEIGKKIKDVKGVKKISSSSSVGVSSITVEIATGHDTQDVLNDLKSEVDKVSLPATVEKPIVAELDLQNNFLFFTYLYGEENKISQFDLMQKAKLLKQDLEKNPYISAVKLSPSGDYDIKVLIHKDKLEQLNLSITEISNSISSNNKNTPIGNYTVGDLNYDFRFEGKLVDIEDLKNVVIRSVSGSVLKLGDIADIKEEYPNETIQKLGFFGKTGYNYVTLMIEKSDSSDVFSSASSAKKQIENLIKNDKNFAGVDIIYTSDLSDYIKEDYQNLASTALQTLVLVFLTILFFVSFKDGLIAVLILPLSFFVTFIFLYYGGYTLNFLTNFSLVLSLTIGIDTVIVIIEGASEKQKMGYTKKYAILMAIKEFKAPLISGTLTTLVVFLPMMALPGIMGKFLGYIPITVFSTLLAGLIVALTLSSAVYMFLARERTDYHRDEESEKNLTSEQKIFLESQRQGKVEIKDEKLSYREKFLGKMGKIYFNYLIRALNSRTRRFIIILLPIILTILSFFLSPLIGFNFFQGNNIGIISATITGKQGSKKESLEKYLPEIETMLSSIKNIKNYGLTISGNKITIEIETLPEKQREPKSIKLSDIGKEVSLKLDKFLSNGLKVEVIEQSDGPPATGDLGVKLISDSSSNLDDLKKVTNDFEKFFKSLEGIKNIKSSGTDTPGQFVFKFDESKLSQLGIGPNDMLSELYFYINGMSSGSIKSRFEDNDIVLKIKEFEDNFSPEDLLNISVNTRIGKVRIGDVASYDFTKSVSTINREDNKISISISADVDTDAGFVPSQIQPKLIQFMKNYNYPDGITYEQGGENVENKELITAMISALFVSLFLIFFILVVQFNSYRQPGLIFFSILLSILGVNVGLFITQTPYSMMFMIGFISLAGVVINDAIILIDRANKNLEKGLEPIYAIASAGQSRLQPILVTTITTVLGVFPLAIQSPMWAGLGYTIMFGLLAGSLLTIYCMPILYYNSYLKRVEGRIGIIGKIFRFIFWPLRKMFSLFRKKRKKS